MRVSAVVVGLFLSLFAALPALAQSKIGFVNADRVVRESAPAARALKKLEKEFEKREQELQKTSKQLQVLEDTLEKSSASLNEADRRNKEREFNDLSREFQRRQREYREDRTQRQNDELAGVAERANRAIRQIAEAEHFDLILQEAVYFSPAIDITDKVLKLLAETK
ncbi:MAG: OmpH family outer membrane protein [Uliginosibacterium sp.]|jgi:outer membrane protein|nr:OmpH family outer membrane protein [Uliginosibacterium sp.]MBK9616596.1 OmpH family outer membrane protein [Uliginosibacterium sp.]